jgi:L-amino acid N-acyltransferase YncA
MSGDDISIRVAERPDAAAIAAIYAPIVRETAISFEIEPPSAEDMAGRIETTLQSHPWLVAVRAGDVVGYAYAGQHQHAPPIAGRSMSPPTSTPARVGRVWGPGSMRR